MLDYLLCKRFRLAARSLAFYFSSLFEPCGTTMFKQEGSESQVQEETYTVAVNEEGNDVYTHNMNFIMDSGEFAAISQMIPTLDSDVERSILAEGGGLLALNDETMDVAAKFHNTQTQYQPLWPRGPPARSPFSGELNFHVEISASDTHRRRYLYSHQLNRIYVDIRVSFPVTFRWDPNLVPGPMFVRATVVFSDQSQAEKRVERCTQHTHEHGADTNLTIVKNVLHSSREKNTQGVYYCGQPEWADSWYSVLVEFPSGPGTHAFEFGCKNSCPNGINRRAIDIIFNLEDSKGMVYGRQLVGARVCACPRRDMHKDEETEGVGRGKRRMAPGTPATGAPAPGGNPEKAKKVKLELVVEGDDEAITLPPLEVIGSRALSAGLQVMALMMEQAAEHRKQEPQAAQRYATAAAKIRAHVDGMKKTRHT